MDTSKSTETAHQRLSRILNMGKYGDRLALELLDLYLDEWLASGEDLTPWRAANRVG